MADPRGIWRRSVAGRVWRQGQELELMHRAMGFAALGLVTLMPLLIVVAAAAPFQRTGFAQWIVDGMGLSDRPSDAVRHLFGAPRKVLSTTSALSLASLAFFGLSFAANVETGYLKIWELPANPWHSAWRRAVWLAALTAYLFAEAQSATVLRHGWLPNAARIAFTCTTGFVFFWWGLRFLLGNRVGRRSALPGAVFTMLGLVGLRVFSTLVLSPLTVSNAVTYGPVGTVLIVQCWLIGVGFVIFGAALLGRHVHERAGRRRAAGWTRRPGGAGQRRVRVPRPGGRTVESSYGTPASEAEPGDEARRHGRSIRRRGAKRWAGAQGQSAHVPSGADRADGR
jgi:membrane protein